MRTPGPEAALDGLTRCIEIPRPDHWVANFPNGRLFFCLDPGTRPPANVINLKFSWKTAGSGFFAKSEHGYYLVYRNIDPESKLVCWYAKFEPLVDDYLKPEKFSQSQSFSSFEHAQMFCEKHAQSLEP